MKQRVQSGEEDEQRTIVEAVIGKEVRDKLRACELEMKSLYYSATNIHARDLSHTTPGEKSTCTGYDMHMTRDDTRKLLVIIPHSSLVFNRKAKG